MKKPRPALRKTLWETVDSIARQAEASSEAFLFASAKVAPASADFMMLPRSPATYTVVASAQVTL